MVSFKLGIVLMSFFFRVMMECSVNSVSVLMGQSQLFALTKQMDALLLGVQDIIRYKRDGATASCVII